MPKSTKRRSQSRRVALKRLSNESCENQKPQQSSSEDEDFVDTKDDSINFTEKDMLFEISDVYSLCKEQCNPRFLSTMVYMILKHFDISFRHADAFLSSIGGMTAKTCHKWTETFLKDFGEFVNDGRGGKHKDGFYDVYPDLEIEAKAFVVAACSQKSNSFVVSDLANFVDKRFYEINNLVKTDNALIRSVESCRLDLRRWGARYKANSNRPYFEGHERADVVVHRKEFIKYFLARKHEYYSEKK
jgi:hypothetical protein